MKHIKMAALAATCLSALPARAGAALSFDASQVEPDQGLDVLPPGFYNVVIDESDMKPTKDGTGSYLSLRFSVLDGQYKSRKVYTNLNLKNANAQAVEIAQRQLSAICHAVGVLRPQDSQELHGKPLKIKVKIRKGTGDYSDSNDIVSYKDVNEQVDMAGGDSAGAASFGAGGGDQPAQPWATGAAADQAGKPEQEQKPAEGDGAPAQPWSQPGDGAPAAPGADAPAEHDPVAAAEADGWKAHPDSAGWHYKGQDVVKTEELGEKYPAPSAAPATPSAPPAPDSPPATPPAEGGDAAAQAGEAAPPWAKKD